MSDNWIVQNLEQALRLWNEKMAEIVSLASMSPKDFRGGAVWTVVEKVHGSMQAIAYALLVLFFVGGIMKTAGSLAEFRRPEQAVKPFIRFAVSKALISRSMELMLSFLDIVSGITGAITAPQGTGVDAALPAEITESIEACGFLESIPLWAVTLISSLLVWVLAFSMVLTVYGRFFRIYLFAAIAPIPLASFAGEPTQGIGRSFLKSCAAAGAEGAAILLACVIFSALAGSPPAVQTDAAPAVMVWSYFGELIFNMLILSGAVRMSDRVAREIMGI